MSDAMHTLLAATPLLDLHHPDVEALVTARGWRSLAPYDRIGAVYDFVRNEVAFGYNEGDELPGSRVLADDIEVSLEGRWIELEGFILDAPYLASLQRRFPQARSFCGYGAATPDLSAPGVEWRGQDTYIQKDGIADDFGVFDSPDAFYARHGSNLSGLKRWLYERVIRHWMNRNVCRVRASRW